MDRKLEHSILDILNEGFHATWLISKQLNMKTAKVRTVMKSMQQRGLVRRHSILTRKNNIVWMKM